MRAKATRIATPPPLERAVALRILMAETLADDFAAFAKKGWTILHPHRKLAWSWHYDYLCELLTLVKQRRLLRLFVNVLPRTLRSSLITIRLPVWMWPTSRVLALVTARSS